jgi:hypothetical protein
VILLAAGRKVLSCRAVVKLINFSQFTFAFVLAMVLLTPFALLDPNLRVFPGRAAVVF